MFKKNQCSKQKDEPSEVFISFLQGILKNEHLGGENIVKHSRSILKLFSRGIPEKLYHSNRYSSQSTTGSISVTLSPSQNESCRNGLKEVWEEENIHPDLHKKGYDEDKECAEKMIFAENILSRCLTDSLMVSHLGSSLNANLVSGEILDLEENSNEFSSPSSIYRVMTSTTVTFSNYKDYGAERLNNALREDRLRRISTHSNRIWPSNVSSYLQGIDLFLRIPRYIRPKKDEGGILSLSIGSYSHPHPSKVHYGGEDAHFYEENVIGVADGVGEWANFGVNPKSFANELISGMRNAYLNMKCKKTTSSLKNVAILKNLMQTKDISKERAKTSEIEKKFKIANLKCESFLNNNKMEHEYEQEIQNEHITESQHILNEGYKNTKSFGSSTAFVACFDPISSKLKISYLGDSGIIVLRRTPETFRMGIVYRSPAQQHSFNCPFQLSKLPTQEDFPKLQEKGLTCFINLVKNSGNIPQDLPSHSISKEINISQSDLIVIATDGLFDNLYDYEICSICSGAISPYEAIRLLNDATLTSSPHNISKALANAAYLKSLDPKAKTPFNKQSLINNEPWQFNFGGKLDDITVVVAWVVCEQDQNILNNIKEKELLK